MTLFKVEKNFETLERAGMADWFQVITLLDEDDNDITNRIDTGQHFLDNNDLKQYLSKIFNIPDSDIEIEEL